MKQEIEVKKTTPGLWQDTNVTYAQVPGWLGNGTKDMKLSVVYPFAGQSKRFPLIVWFSGGGWMTSNHNIHLPNFSKLAKHGYVIAGVDYRNSNQAIWPAPLQDAKAAIRYLKQHAKKYNIDPNQVIVMGESAGGHLASMVATTNGLKQYDVGDNLNQTSQVQMAIPFYGVVNLLSAKQNSKSNDFDFVYRNELGGEPETSPEQVKLSDPNHFIDDNTKNIPEFLIFHGQKDEVVPIRDSEELADHLQQKHIPVNFYAIKDGQHMDEKFFQPQITNLVLEQLNQKFKGSH